MNIIEFLEKNPETGRKKLSKMFGISENKARKIVREFKESYTYSYQELLDKSVKIELQNQKLRDEQRVERKIRDQYRNTNYLSEMMKELIDCFKNYKTNIIKHETFNNDYAGIIHLSDWHLNEIVNLRHNKYNFKIASQRAKKLVCESKRVFKSYGIKNVLIAMTGDFISAIKHPDQLISMETSRSQAVFVGASIIEQMISDLNEEFNISVCAVAGNETRESSFKVVPANSILMSDNLDINIFSILKVMFRNTNVKFLSTNIIDCIVKVNKYNFLFTHSHTLNHSNLQKAIMELKGKYVNKNTRIDFVAFGHIHNSIVSPDGGYFRCGGLIGDNNFSYNSLNYCSKASQNIYIVGNDEVNGMSIDLQKYENFEGYNINQEIIDGQDTDKNEINVLRLDL